MHMSHAGSLHPASRTINSMPFYRILGDWDEMGPSGDAEADGAGAGKANQQVCACTRDPRSPACARACVRACPSSPHVFAPDDHICPCVCLSAVMFASP